MALTVVLEGVTTLFRGLGLFQKIIRSSHRSGLCGPLLRSIYNERENTDKFSIYMGEVKNCLGSSIWYYQARENSFWAVLEALEKIPSASPSPNLVF